MKISIEYNVTDCRDCPFKYEHRGHGECWAECNHKDNGKGCYENILWGCQEKFKSVPTWCPLGIGTPKEPQGKEEPKCAFCGSDMKWFVTCYRCRNLKCRAEQPHRNK